MTEDRPVVDDRYALLTRVGRGATGEVFKALDLTNRDIVAVKLVDLEDAEDDIEEASTLPKNFDLLPMFSTSPTFSAKSPFSRSARVRSSPSTSRRRSCRERASWPL